MGKMLYFVTVIGVFLQTINGQEQGMEKLEECPCANEVIEIFLDSVANNTVEVNNGQKLRLRLWQIKNDDCSTRVLIEPPKPGRIEIDMQYRGDIDILNQGEEDGQYGSDDNEEPQGKVDFGQQFGGMDYGAQQGVEDIGPQQGSTDSRQQFGGMDIGQQQEVENIGQQQGVGDIGPQQGSADFGQQFGDMEIGQQQGVDIGQQQGVWDIGPKQGRAGFGQQFGGVDVGQQQGFGDIRPQQGSADFGQQFRGVDVEPQQEVDNGPQQGVGDIGPQQGVGDIGPQQGVGDIGPQQGVGDIGPQQGVGDIGPQQGVGNGQQPAAQDSGLPQDIDIEQLLGNLALEEVQQSLEKLQSQVIDTTEEQAGTDTPQGQAGVDETQEQVGADYAQKQSELPSGSYSGTGKDSAAFTFTVDVNTGKLSESVDAAPVSNRRKRDIPPFDSVVVKIVIDFEKNSDSNAAARNDQIRSVLRRALADYWLALAYCLLDVKQ